jgi:hypothetical protein
MLGPQSLGIASLTQHPHISGRFWEVRVAPTEL